MTQPEIWGLFVCGQELNPTLLLMSFDRLANRDVDLKDFYFFHIMNSPSKPWGNRNLSLPHIWKNVWHLKWEQFLLCNLINTGKIKMMFYALYAQASKTQLTPKQQCMGMCRKQIHPVMSAHSVSCTMCKQCTFKGNTLMCLDLYHGSNS